MALNEHSKRTPSPFFLYPALNCTIPHNGAYQLYFQLDILTNLRTELHDTA